MVAASEGEELNTADDCVLQGRLNNSETLLAMPSVLKHLSSIQSQELTDLLGEFKVLFSDVPTQTDLLKHDIDVGGAESIWQRFYRVPIEKKGKSERRGSVFA